MSQGTHTVGVATVYRGYNYGSALQAYATQEFIRDMGYDVQLLSRKSVLSRTRNVGLGKLLVMMGRMLRHPRLLVETVRAYGSHLSKPVSETTRALFEGFYGTCLKTRVGTWSELKRFAALPGTLACICGSDQIWNASHAYLDPLYYLRFAPRQKRIAFASSMGRSSVPGYNYRGIKKRVQEIPSLSVRERHAAGIIDGMIGRTPSVIIDPTLLLDGIAWRSKVSGQCAGVPDGEYVLLYFLDSPSAAALEFIRSFAQTEGCKMITVLYRHEVWNQISEVAYVDAGPSEFVNLIGGASLVCTDSFHGTAFAVNFSIPFWVFDRSYGTAESQSSRIRSLLETVALEDRFICDESVTDRGEPCDFRDAQTLLVQEREKAKKYLADALARAGSE